MSAQPPKSPIRCPTCNTPEAKNCCATEFRRLDALVKKAVDAGFALEEAYAAAQKSRHNWQQWDDDQWDPIQAARNALGAILKEVHRG